MRSTTSSMGIPLIFVASCFCVYSGIGAVSIHVTSPITAALYQRDVTLPCRYSLDQLNGKNTIAWRVHNKLILKADSQGDLHIANSYSRRVGLADGCSLVLKNLSLTDTANYTVSILALNDNRIQDFAMVNLVVALQSTTVKNETQPVLAENSTHDVTSESSGTNSEDEPGFIKYLGIATALPVLTALLAYIVLTKDNVCQKDVSNPETKIRQYHAIVVNLLPVLITALCVNTAFLPCVWNTVAQGAVGIWIGIVLITIICSAVMKYRAKRKLQ